jgi:hypothetical protein
MDIRKTVTIIEDTLMDAGKPLSQPSRRVAVIAVVRNPLVTRDDENLSELNHDGEDLGRFLAQRALEHVDRRRVTLVGKAAIVGSDGEPEHGQAILYPKFAAAVREALDAGSVRMTGEKKIGPAGSAIEVMLQPVDGSVNLEAVSRLEIRVPGSPRGDEILVALAVASTNGTKA